MIKNKWLKRLVICLAYPIGFVVVVGIAAFIAIERVNQEIKDTFSQPGQE